MQKPSKGAVEHDSTTDLPQRTWHMYNKGASLSPQAERCQLVHEGEVEACQLLVPKMIERMRVSNLSDLEVECGL